MQEDRDHKGFLNRVRSFIIEDVPADSEEESDAHEAVPAQANPVPAKHGSDDVDRMFADIESEVSGGVKPPAQTAVAHSASVDGPATASPSSGGDVLSADVKRVIKIIDSLPQVLTREQVMPILAATMEAANIDAVAVAAQLNESKRSATDAIVAAQQEIDRVEHDCEETLARLQKLMEAARSQSIENVAAQQKRIGELNAALETLARVSGYLATAPASTATEIKT